MTLHPLHGLDDEQRRSLLAFYRSQEAMGNLKITSSDFRDGELLVVNYTEQFNSSTAPEDWGWRMEAARGCVFFKANNRAPEVVVRAMPKFHGYRHCPEAQQYLDDGDGLVTVMQKFDGSCISVTCYCGEVLFFTRGVRLNFQTKLARSLLNEKTMASLEEMEGRSLAFELIHQLDAKCEESRGPDRLVLLYVCEATGVMIPVTELEPIAQTLCLDCATCEHMTGNTVMQKIQVLNAATSLEELREGFVVEILGKRYKVKSQLYQSLARNPIPRPNQAWLDKCFSRSKCLEDVRHLVGNMRDAPLDYFTLAENLLDRHLARITEQVVRLRGLHQQFQSPRDLQLDDTIAKEDKTVLFPCLRLPAGERDAWFESEACHFKVAQSLVGRFAERSHRGFPVASGRLVLCGAPGKRSVLDWAEGLDCVVTLLRGDEVNERNLDLATELAQTGVEWLHLPISGAALQGSDDQAAVKAAASAVVQRVTQGKTVAVHCSAGLHRTGIVGYLTLRLLGHSMASSFELLGQIRWETRRELERLHFKNESTTPDTPGQLVSVAEELLEAESC